MAGDCGKCTMCCKVMVVTSLKKPKNKLCEHCNVGTGCRIYNDRPTDCQAFRCFWLQTQTAGPAPLPVSLRPDKCKVVLHASADEKSIIAKVDPNYPHAWKAGQIGLMLGNLAEKNYVLVDNGKEYFLLNDGMARKAKMSLPDENGDETFLGYIDD